MTLNLLQIDTEASVFLTSEVGMNRRSNEPSQRIISRKGPPSFAGWNKPQRALLLLLVLAGNVLVASVAWIIVRLVKG
jgi:uncharacterized protein involved in exopolysaccharide biosynthesis